MVATYVCVGQSGTSSNTMTFLIKFTKPVHTVWFPNAYIAFNFCGFASYAFPNHTHIQNTTHIGWPNQDINVSC